ncbi:MAG: hypothetical protein K1X79_07580, partial [Oligoflexia bacterium]|nr:hypothetical protein [Oligoflexia bacterium]
GYSCMILCVLCAYASYLNRSWGVYWGASILGYLAHSTYLQFLACLILADVWAEFCSAGFAAARRAIVFRHALPIILIGLFVIFVQGSPELGGGPQLSHIEIGLNTLLAVLGMPELSLFNVPVSAYGLLAALILWVLLAREAWALRNIDGGQGIFFFLLVIVFPLLVVLAIKPPVLFVRYFLPAILFAYLLLARMLARFWYAGLAGRTGAVCVMALLLWQNGEATRSLWDYGRSSFRQILEYVDMAQDGGKAVISGYPDHRNELLIEGNARFLPRTSLLYHAGEYPNALEAEWVFLQSQDEFFVADPVIGKDYRCQKFWPAARYSGVSVFVYRKQVR